MKISKFKNEAAKTLVEEWIDATLANSALTYEKSDVETSFGQTHILAVGHSEKHLKRSFTFPARECAARFSPFQINCKFCADDTEFIYLMSSGKSE